MKKILFSFLAIFLMTTIGCKEEILLPEMVNGEDGISTIFAFDVLAPTEDHLNGGWVMEVGADVNANGTLDPDEVQATVPLWHGNDGLNGTNGKDGLNGIDGIDGTNGADGLDGTDGKDGVDGQTPDLYLLTVDLPATEGHENGGVLVTTVWDKDGDQLISDGEIVGAYTVWHGNNGADGIDGQNGSDGVDGKSPYIEDGYWFYWSSETNTWINGGKAQGADGVDGQNGQDGAAGIDGKSPYILNGFWYFWNGTVWVNGGKSTGEDGADGAKGDKGDQGERGTIVGYTVETAQNCTTNGYRVTMTIDENLPTEYQMWFEVCDGRVGDTGAVGAQGAKGDKGEDGYTSLILVTPKNDDGCITIYTGLDTDRSGTLDRDEVNYDQARTICDGDDGTNGIDGKTSIVLAERFTRSGYSGVMITTGFDTDGDYNTIEEVLSISYILDGTNGTNGEDGETTTITLEEDGDCVIITTYLGETQIDTETICSCSLDDCDDDGCGEDNDKVAVCNYLGNGRTHTIWINENAVDAHLDRNPNDTLGECAYESGRPQ